MVIRGIFQGKNQNSVILQAIFVFPAPIDFAMKCEVRSMIEGRSSAMNLSSRRDPSHGGEEEHDDQVGCCRGSADVKANATRTHRQLGTPEMKRALGKLVTEKRTDLIDRRRQAISGDADRREAGRQGRRRERRYPGDWHHDQDRTKCT